MEKKLYMEDFLSDKLLWMPENLRSGFRQFNVFSLTDVAGTKVNCQPFNRKGYYKISLITGPTKIFYADKSIEIKRSGLMFSNPHIPYSWENIGPQHSGFFCVFYGQFFNQFGHISEYPVFKPGNTPLFELSVKEEEEITKIFVEMLDEINSDFIYKYDVLRNQVLELIYKALKMQPSATAREYNESNGAIRVASSFIELLERQFPIEPHIQQMQFRSPSGFAGQLSIHINHLNRSLKKITGKTTSQLIEERVIQEAKGLLKHTEWGISDIAWGLGFEDLSHFINFFKKSELMTPGVFRKKTKELILNNTNY